MSNLTGRPVYAKGQRLTKKANYPTVNQKRFWQRLVGLGCVVANAECRGRITVHHCMTGLGVCKDHEACIPLCIEHHLGDRGIDGKRMSKREWQVMYGLECDLLAKVRELLA